MPKYQEFLEKVIKSIVSKPEEVKIDRMVNERGVLLTLKVAPEDVGIVIGKKGQTIQAIRYLTRIVGLKNRAAVSIRVEQ